MIIKRPSLILHRRSLILGAAASLLVPCKVLAAVTFPQFNVNTNMAGASSLSVSFTNPIAAGSFIAVATAINSGVASYTISDGHGDTFTDCGLGIVTNAGIGAKMQVGALLAPTSGAQTITITPNVNFSFCELIAWEIAGITSPTIDKAVTGTTGGTTPTSGTTGTLSSASEAAIGYGIVDNGAFSAAGSGWTLDSLTPFSDLAQHQILSSNAAIAATGTQAGASNTQMFCVTFMAGGAPPAKPPTRNLTGVGL
jgi:hypothetical protein